ncbi:MAG: molecular chaperone [Gammaproteobacteria bacterium]|nr:molecular chaperone [Gammaproteobacteria bacterium]
MATVPAYAGIDFGTSNCTAGYLQQGEPTLWPLEADSCYLSSALYIEKPPVDDEDEIKTPSLNQLLREQHPVYLGQAAHKKYSQDPLGGVFIRSPKSMLGSRLTPAQTQVYEKVCALMLKHIRQRAGGDALQYAVLGRPIHFQGIDGAQGDDRAEAILRAAAASVGFKDIQFAYEPVAAAIEYERTLSSEQKVLVVDIGGGTSDISLVRLGPQLRQQSCRTADLLGHAGRRIGGVDMDIKLAIYGLMPALGRGTLAQTGRPLPSASFSDAVNIIDIQAQENFYQKATAKTIATLIADAQQPLLVERLLTLYRHHLSYYLVQQAEQAKIELASAAEHQVSLARLDANLAMDLTADTLSQAIYVELNGIRKLVQDCLQSAGSAPDQIFLTGGASAAAGVVGVLQQVLPETPIMRGDRFGSVGKGLCSIANQLYQ